MNKYNLWQAVLAELQLTLSKAAFTAWFTNTKVIKISQITADRQLVEIAVVNPYAKNTIEARYLGQVKEILDRLTKKANELKIIVQTEAFKPKNTTPGPLFNVDFEMERKRALERAVNQSHLKLNFTFETFAVSSSNEMAYAASQAVAKNPGKTYNLLFLYGGVGVGKTHLTHAIGHKILEHDLHASLVYCTSEEFTNAIVEAIQSKSTMQFRRRFRLAKALLIDDIQFIAGKEAVQEEFFHTFNAIHAEGGQIVLTSDRLPHQIEGLEDRLRSRFEGGLTIDVQEPNFELRTAILLIKAKQMDQPLPMDVAQLIASNITSTRALEGFLSRLLTESQIRKKPVTPEFCQSLLQTTTVKKVELKRLIKPKEVLETVASYFNLNLAQIKGSRRAKPIVVPRQLAMYLIRTELRIPYMEVGHLFGNRDHTTVMHAVDKISKLINTSEEIRINLAALKKRLYG